VLQQYHQWTLDAMAVLADPTGPHGMFVDSCWVHCQASSWNSGPTIGGRNIAQTFGDWYFGRVPDSQVRSGRLPRLVFA
jgi:hypothetical protein